VTPVFVSGEEMTIRLETDPDGSVHAVTEGTPGRNLMPQWSDHLGEWNDALTLPVYSFGGMHQLEILPPGSMSPGGGNPGGGGNGGGGGDSVEAVTLILRAFTDTNDTLIFDSRSVNGSGELATLDFTGAPPIFGWQNDSYSYLIAVTQSLWEPNYQLSAGGLPAELQPAVDAFKADYADIKTEIIEPFIASGQAPDNTTSSSVEGGGDRQFARWKDTNIMLDSDGDGLTDTFELTAFNGRTLNPFSSDTDGDGLNDFLGAVTLGSDPFSGVGDADGDGISDGEEAVLGTGLLSPDVRLYLPVGERAIFS